MAYDFDEIVWWTTTVSGLWRPIEEGLSRFLLVFDRRPCHRQFQFAHCRGLPRSVVAEPAGRIITSAFILAALSAMLDLEMVWWWFDGSLPLPCYVVKHGDLLVLWKPLAGTGVTLPDLFPKKLKPLLLLVSFGRGSISITSWSTVWLLFWCLMCQWSPRMFATVMKMMDCCLVRLGDISPHPMP